jgi:hypothetical protein
MKCPYCTTSNRDARRFCSRCGVILGWACGRCAFFNHLGEQHCGGCGGAQSGTAPTPTTGTSVADHTLAVAPTSASGRSLLITNEIDHFRKEQVAKPKDQEQSAPVSQADIDNLFRR